MQNHGEGPGAIIGELVPVTWIAEVLEMGDAKRAAKLVQGDPDPGWGRDWKEAKRLMGELGQEDEKR